jgi:uncharacterized protein
MKEITTFELLETCIKKLVDDPNKVSINEVKGNKSTIYEVDVPKEELGKIIGNHGRIIQSLRTLIRAIESKKEKRTIEIELNE